MAAEEDTVPKKFEPKEPTGREYVDKTTKFCGYTIFQCSRFPQHWDSLYLAPIMLLANDIESQVRQANKVWMGTKEKPLSKEDGIAALQERCEYLKKAIGLFADFDIKFDRLMSAIDIAGSERRRLTNILYNIIDEEKAKNPELDNIRIDVHAKLNEVCYTSAVGEQRLKLRLTAKQRDHWLKLESEAKTLITGRLQTDKKAISRLQAK